MWDYGNMGNGFLALQGDKVIIEALAIGAALMSTSTNG
jgi:hypothetical protein